MNRQMDDNERLLRDRIAADPRDTTALRQLAQLVGSRRDRKSEAVELWRRHLEVADSTRSAEALLALGRAQIEARLEREAIGTLRRCIADDPGNFEALCTLGELLRRNGEVEAAASAFRRAVEREPDSIAARLGLLDCLDASGDEAEAQSVLKSIQRQAAGDQAIAALLRELMQRRER
jgi:cytochrome c-type biogenesis protein CcmH/NrfG